MTFEEYEKEKLKLKEQYELEQNNLHKKFALSNNTIKIGDIIQDDFNKIKVEKIIVYHSTISMRPECYYYGAKLNKNNEPLKPCRKESVCQLQMLK